MNRRPAAGAHACFGEGLTPKAKILARAIVPLGRRARHRTELRLRRNVQRRTKRGWRLEAATVLDRDVRNRRMPADEDRNAGHWRNLATPTVGSSPRSSLEPEDNEAHLREQAHLPQPAAELALLSAGSHHRALSLLHNEAQDHVKITTICIFASKTFGSSPSAVWLLSFPSLPMRGLYRDATPKMQNTLGTLRLLEGPRTKTTPPR